MRLSLARTCKGGEPIKNLAGLVVLLRSHSANRIGWLKTSLEVVKISAKDNMSAADISFSRGKRRVSVFVPVTVLRRQHH